MVRHAARMFVTSANIDVPLMTVVALKGYGLGAQAMAGGISKATLFTVTWPTGEFGGMGLEGAVEVVITAKNFRPLKILKSVQRPMKKW